MTWLLGGRGPWSAFLVADTRVTLTEACVPPKEHHLDVVQKVHLVRPNVLVGFAGSARIGFDVVDALLRAPEIPTFPVLHEFTSDFLPSLIRRIFEAAPDDERQHRCDVIVAGCHVAKGEGIEALFGWQTVAKYASEAGFETEYPKPLDAFLSSGASPERLREFTMNTNRLARFSTPDAAALVCAFTLRHYLETVPVDSVSDRFVLGTVTPHGSLIKPFVTYSNQEGRVVRHGPNDIVRTYADLERYVRQYEETLVKGEHSSLSLRSKLA